MATPVKKVYRHLPAWFVAATNRWLAGFPSCILVYVFAREIVFQHVHCVGMDGLQQEGSLTGIRLSMFSMDDWDFGCTFFALEGMGTLGGESELMFWLWNHMLLTMLCRPGERFLPCKDRINAQIDDIKRGYIKRKYQKGLSFSTGLWHPEVVPSMKGSHQCSNR